MIIDCISDLHGNYPELEDGDLLIVAGDLTARDTEKEIIQLENWLYEQDYKKVIFIAGNHDNHFEGVLSNHYLGWDHSYKITYLCDSGTEFEGLKIWGSPWTKAFAGMNPKCMAFTLDSEEKLAEKWALIPDDIDILVTHSPPYGIMDTVHIEVFCGERDESTGSESLKNRIEKIMPDMLVFGHIHENGGQYVKDNGIIYVNASYVNENYEPVNKPIRVIL